MKVNRKIENQNKQKLRQASKDKFYTNRLPF